MRRNDRGGRLRSTGGALRSIGDPRAAALTRGALLRRRGGRPAGHDWARADALPVRGHLQYRHAAPLRSRGYAAAVTARAVADGLSGGAEWAWLRSSPAGYPVYTRLGFKTVERWSSWVSAT